MNIPVNIQEFIKLAQRFPVIDVRSPAEFSHGHIPRAHNIPLFDNEERAKVGTAYKQISQEAAIQIGYELANPKIKSFIDQVQAVVKPSTILIHCWRGGMRSAKFAELLNQHGYNTHTLIRGYKAYRNFVLESFNNSPNIIIIGGETGSGKTEILQKIKERGEQIIDLENLAHHKGSAFGSLGEKPQPTQEQFENNLAYNFSKVLNFGKVWLEDESRNTGRVQLPQALWEKMKQSPILRVNIPKKLRIERLVNDYGKFSKEELKNCVLKIQQRLGGQHVKHALEELEKGNLHEVVDITLTYYDKAYNYNHEKRNMKDVFFVECETADASTNADKLIEVAKKIKQVYA
ncbi:MAG: tRNA 2-selenouridine(34) synthase MnmH [Bacteroidetes bacterium]|nr:tRNA 2-selenouridine(34) synthase MnmH [Bacteroidota bacterium]